MLPPKMITINGIEDKSNVLLLISIINLALLLIPIAAEYRYRKALKKNEKIVEIYFSRYLHRVKLRIEDFLPVMYMKTILISLITVVMYNYWFLATIYNWDLSALRTPGAPFQLHMLVILVPVFLIASILLAIIIKYDRKARKMEEAQKSPL